jgi:hypothetical protein
MKTRVFGKIMKVRYSINWSLDDTFEQHLENPEQYIEEYKELVDEVELNEKTITRGKPKCTVLETVVDVDKQEILLYTDYIARVIAADEFEKQQKINNLISHCNERITKYNELKANKESKKWYKFWK